MNMPSHYQKARFAHECRLVLVLDCSTSMKRKDWPPNRWAAAVEASRILLAQLALHEPDALVSIAAFSTGPRVVHPPTVLQPNLGRLVWSMGLVPCGGQSNIKAGLTMANWLLLQPIGTAKDRLFHRAVSWVFGSQAEPVVEQPKPQEIIVLLTDGRHSGGPEPEPLAQQIRQRGVRIDVVGIGGDRRQVDEKRLERIATKGSDGLPRYWFISQPLDLFRRFEELGKHLRAI